VKKGCQGWFGDNVLMRPSIVHTGLAIEKSLE